MKSNWNIYEGGEDGGVFDPGDGSVIPPPQKPPKK